MLNELTILQVYGTFVSKEITNIYMNLDKNKIRLNIYDPLILSLPYSYINNTPFSLFSKYYIDGLGTIPRFSKLEKKVKEYYIIALKNKLN
jgi:hypothetical protein